MATTETNTLYRHSFHYFAGLLCSMLLGFVSFPIFTRVFSVSEYGLLDFVLKIVLLFTAVSKMGLQHSALRFYDGQRYASDASASRKYYSTMLYGTVISGACATLLFVIAVYAAGSLIAPSTANLLLLASALILLRGLESMLWSFLRVEERTKAYNIWTTIMKAGTVLVACTVVLVGQRSVASFLVALITVESAVVALLVWGLLRRGLLALPHFDSPLFRDAVVFGSPLIAYELATILLDSGDRALVRYYLGADALGYYSVAYNLSSYVNDLLIAPLNLAIVPIYLKIWKADGPAKTAAFLSQTTEVFLAVAIGVLAIVFVTSRDALIILASSKYEASARLVPVLAGGLLLYTTHIFLSAGLIIHKKTLTMAKLVLYACAAKIGLNCILLPRIGILGAAIATLLSYSLCVALMARASLPILPLKIEPAALVKYFTAAGATVALMIPIQLGSPLFNVAGRGLLALIAYTSLLCMLDKRVRDFVADCLNTVRLNGAGRVRQPVES